MPDQSFGKEARLCGKREFDRVFRDGRKTVGRDLILWALRQGEVESGARLGLSVSRKLGGAVRRNRLKRLLREAFRQNRHRMAGYDLVAYPRPGCGWKSLGDAEGSLLTLCQRAGILHRSR